MAIYFWSDTHFNHQGILKYTNRPFVDVRLMNDWLIGLWNLRVTEKDTVYLLGDFAFKHPLGDDIEGIFYRLRGHKHLIVGNHDERNPVVMKLPWESQHALYTVKDQGMRAEVCHYPLETWKSSWRGTLMLHGHCHGTLKRQIPRRFDVGVDAEGRGGPISFQELWERGQAQAFEAQDRHGEDNRTR